MSTTCCNIITTHCRLHGTSTTAFHKSVMGRRAMQLLHLQSVAEDVLHLKCATDARTLGNESTVQNCNGQLIHLISRFMHPVV